MQQKNYSAKAISSKRWILEPSEAKGSQNRTVRIDFTEESISVMPGCNRYDGDFIIEGTQLKLSNIQKTDIICSKKAQELDEAFINKIQNTEIVVLDKSKMHLKDRDSALILKFKAFPKSNQKGTITHIWEVHPKKVNCLLGTPQKCNYIRLSESDSWMVFPHPIEGFDFKSGISYKIKVLETFKEGKTSYTLDSIIKQTVKGTRQVLIGTQGK